MRRRNIIAALVLMGVGVGYGYLTSRLPIRTLPNTPPPSFLPWINTVVLLVLSAALLVQGLVLTADGRDGAGQFPPRARVRAAWTLAAFVVYLAALPILGFVVATIPFFAALMVIFGERRVIWVAGGAIGAPLFLFVVFRHGFGVFLPRGLLPGLVG